MPSSPSSTVQFWHTSLTITIPWKHMLSISILSSIWFLLWNYSIIGLFTLKKEAILYYMNGQWPLSIQNCFKTGSPLKIHRITTWKSWICNFNSSIMFGHSTTPSSSYNVHGGISCQNHTTIPHLRVRLVGQSDPNSPQGEGQPVS